MALFGSKKKVEAAPEAPKKEKVVKAAAKAPKAVKSPSKAVAVAGSTSSGTSAFNSSAVILRPRITEKSGVLSQGGVYTFEVTLSANKNSVASAIKSLYKVTPVKVAILNNPAKNVFVRGRHGVVAGVRKALVTLKKGDKIEFV
jgi:large subunit ribosomal protein L23